MIAKDRVEDARPFRCELPADPCAIVIFGASGDLARRKLIPALYELAAAACLAPRFAIVGFSRTESSDEAFRAAAAAALADAGVEAGAPERREHFLASLHYVRGIYGDTASFRSLKQRLDALDLALGLRGNRLFHLALPPEGFPSVIENLGACGLAKPAAAEGWVRVIVEKPYGRDLESARALNRIVQSAFEEDQVYRIDHYLGKETVQNLLALRFSNGIFEPLWNRNYIDHVQITAAESLGVERRAAFYDTAGATRDMIQNHILQLVSLTAMEPPARFDATAVRNEKIKVLQAIRPFTRDSIREDVVYGQYGPGAIREAPVPGYREEPGVPLASSTETYAAAKISVENWRWAGVPFYVRTGKRLKRRVTEIAIRFRRAPHPVFRDQELAENWLVITIQPDEGISLSFGAKTPGPEMQLSPVKMSFSYKDSFGSGSPNAYTTLLNDCMRGEATLFDRSDSVDASWTLVDPLVRAARDSGPRYPNYAAGSSGPEAADRLLGREGRTWRGL